LKYLPPFEVIKQLVELTSSRGQLIARASYDDLIKIIKLLLSATDVDEKWYLSKYPDVAEAIAQGAAVSARQHFIDNGYFEGRLPFAITVDDVWYQTENPDVAESIRKGTESSGQAHFVRDGYKEGRVPFPM
jgi:hypothetical protein